MANILIVEGDQENRDLLSKFLARQGYSVMVANTSEEALELADHADLALLDILMPGLSGWDLARILKQEHPDLPFMMLTELTSVDDLVQALELGADDYVAKPYDMRALGARVKTVLRRVGVNDSLFFGDLHICMSSRQVHFAEESLALSRVEFDLLSTLAKYPGKVFSREHLLDRIWGRDYFGTDRVVDVRMVALRKKLTKASAEDGFIETIRGIGYRFNAI